MSVCAVRKTDKFIELSCDTQLTYDTTISSEFLDSSKMFEKNGMIVAGAGPIREINMLTTISQIRHSLFPVAYHPPAN